MLYLIGAGIGENDISVGSIEACGKASKVYYESYTSLISESKVRFISDNIGKPMEGLPRERLEEESMQIVKEAKHSDIAIIFSGDPLIATTHKIIFINAKKEGVPVTIMHSSSVLSAAIGESGLDFYRFGKVATISRWTDSYKPVSFYDSIEANQQNNLHTLLLLDYMPESGSSMQLTEALRILKEAENHYGKGIIKAGMKMFAMVNLGMEKQQKLYLTIEELEKADVEKGPACIILPARLSDIEEEIISSMFY
ncbi:MAG: diphthine synthase [Candidatus Micrarchaeaceae archaeon]